MARRIRDTRKGNRIKTVRAAKRIEPEEVAAALGAEITGEIEDARLDPVAFHALHKNISANLQSTGGRPARSTKTSRKKVSISDAEWADLEKLAAILRKKGVKTTPGQVAGFLLENSLQKLKSPATDPEVASADSSVEDQADQLLEAAASASAPREKLKPVAEELLKEMRNKKNSPA